MSKALTALDKILNMPDPMLQFKWVAKSLPFELPPEYMEGVDIPFNNTSISEGVYVGGKYMYFPGTTSISSFTAAFYEDRNGRALKWLELWKSKVRNTSTGARGLPKDYKRDIVVTQLDSKNNSIITYRLKNCWPADTAALTLNYTDGSARIIHQQTFSVDDIETTFHK